MGDRAQRAANRAAQQHDEEEEEEEDPPLDPDDPDDDPDGDPEDPNADADVDAQPPGPRNVLPLPKFEGDKPSESVGVPYFLEKLEDYLGFYGFRLPRHILPLLAHCFPAGSVAEKWYSESRKDGTVTS
jgi:hypothetical protein